jgi:hypothetical protein
MTALSAAVRREILRRRGVENPASARSENTASLVWAYSVEKLQFRAWRTDFFAIQVD